MGFPPTKLGREVVDSRRLHADAGEPSDDTTAEFLQATGEKCSVKEALRILVVFRRPSVPDVVKVDGEFGGVERSAVAEILARRDDFVPRLLSHHWTSIFSRART